MLRESIQPGKRKRNLSARFSDAVPATPPANERTVNGPPTSTLPKSSHSTPPYNRSRDSLLDPSTSTLNLSPYNSRRSSKSSLSIVSNASSVLFHDETGTGSTARYPKGSLYPDLGNADNSNMTLDEEIETEEEDSLVERLRLSRNDAMQQHLYSTAAFWGQKVYEMTAEPNDAFWLAQVYFLTHEFARAERILTVPKSAEQASIRPQPVNSTRHKGKQRETDPGKLPFSMQSRFPDDLHDVYSGEEKDNRKLVRLTDLSVACRYLAAHCMVRQGKWEDALDLLGHSNPFASNQANGADRSNGHAENATDLAPLQSGIKFEASMCHLRGLIHLHLNATDRAKESFLEALSIDVKCFESFESLIDGSMMTVAEEWNFIQELDFRSQLVPEDAEFVKMAYTVRLKKYNHHQEFAHARERLSKEYGLANDPDVLFGLADELFAGFRWADCYAVTSYILKAHEAHGPTLSLHLACMYQLPSLHSKLFLVAHELVDRSPDSAASWYAVGLWYFANRRWDEARRFFGKSVLLDSRFGPSWIAFGHAYAHEGEHDQAITAYSTAQRHFQGTHLPLLFIGMQHLQLSNTALALEYLKTSWEMCQIDPLLANEIGVTAYWNGQYTDAVSYFNKALALSENVQGSPAIWVKTRINLGHAWRKLREFDKAKDAFQSALDLDPTLSAPYLGLGYVLLATGEQEQAVDLLHEALARISSDQVAVDLLREALGDHVDEMVAEAKKEGAEHVGFPSLSKQTGRSLDDEVDLYEQTLNDGPVSLEPPDNSITNTSLASTSRQSANASASMTVEESAMDLSG